jgi:formylglycine-generating enzyme required for sulfatase activity
MAFASPSKCSRILLSSSILSADLKGDLDASIESLSKLRIKLDLALAEGVRIRITEKEYKSKEKEMISYIESHGLMTRAELGIKMREVIARIQSHNRTSVEEEARKREALKREIEEAHDPVNIAKKMTFFEIRPGKFRMGDLQKVDVEITKPFEMMQTQVTQVMWAKLKIAMGERDIDMITPSEFKGGEGSVVAFIDNIQVQMKPDHPVEQVSYNDVQDFILGLNKLSNSAEIKTQEMLQKLIPDHKKGDVYDLPTEAQWEFVMRDKGNADGMFFDRNDESEILDHAWVSENSNRETHAVATRKPRAVEGKPFYDLEGNVSEWVKDSLDGFTNPLPGGVDPITTTGKYRVLRGSNWKAPASRMRSGIRSADNPDSRFGSHGFRLIRVNRGN